MKLSTLLHKRLVDLLDEKRIVVWYDADRAFADFVGSFKAPNCVVVSAAESILRARRRVDEVYHKLNESEDSAESRANLLIYVPRPRGTTEEKMEDAFAAFAMAGAVFGDKDEDRLESLARQAMPDRTEEIARLFAEAEPTPALLDGLEAGERYPLLREALGSESPTEIVAVVLCDDQKAGKVSGAREELLRLLQADFGFKPPARVRSLEKIRASLATYILFSELVFDLPVGLPDSFSAVARADGGLRVVEDTKGSPFHVAELRPIQLARFDLDEYNEGRGGFTREEWIDRLRPTPWDARAMRPRNGRPVGTYTWHTSSREREAWDARIPAFPPCHSQSPYAGRARGIA